MKKLLFGCCALIALAAFTTAPQTVKNDGGVVKMKIKSGTQLSATLLGSNEVPVPGDPDGMGYVELTLNQGQGTISYTFNIEGIQTAIAAHIHRGAAGVAGPVVIGLTAPSEGMSSGTATADKELIKEIRQNPELFYVNVHNPTYLGGALRGQLSK